MFENMQGLNPNSNNTDVRKAETSAEMDRIVRFTISDARKNIDSCIQQLPNTSVLRQAFTHLKEVYQARTQFEFTASNFKFRNFALAEAVRTLPPGELRTQLHQLERAINNQLERAIDGRVADFKTTAANIELEVTRVLNTASCPADVREKLEAIQTLAQEAQAPTFSEEKLNNEVDAAVEFFNTAVKNYKLPENQNADYSNRLKDNHEKLKKEAAVYTAAVQFSLDACRMEHTSAINDMIGSNMDAIVDKKTGRLDPQKTEQLTDKIRKSHSEHISVLMQRLQVQTTIKGHTEVHWIHLGRETLENCRAIALKVLDNITDNETAYFKRLPKYAMDAAAYTCFQAKTTSGKPAHAHFSGDFFYNDSSWLQIRFNKADTALNKLFDKWVELSDRERDALINHGSMFLQLFIKANDFDQRQRLTEVLPQKEFERLFLAILKNPDLTNEEKLKLIKQCAPRRLEQLDDSFIAKNLYLLNDEMIKYILVKRGYGYETDSAQTVLNEFISKSGQQNNLQLSNPETGVAHGLNPSIDLNPEVFTDETRTDVRVPELKKALKNISLDLIHSILAKHAGNLTITTKIFENLTPEQKTAVDLKYLSHALINHSRDAFLGTFLSFRPMDEKFTQWFYNLPDPERAKVFVVLDANKRAALFSKAKQASDDTPAQSQAVKLLTAIQTLQPARYGDVLQHLPNEALIQHLPELCDPTVPLTGPGGTPLMKEILTQRNFSNIADLIEHISDYDLKNLRLDPAQLDTIDKRFWAFAARKSNLFSNKLIMTLIKEGLDYFGLNEFEEFLEHLTPDQKKMVVCGIQDCENPIAPASTHIYQYVDSGKLSQKGLSYIFKDLGAEDLKNFVNEKSLLGSDTRTAAMFIHALTAEQLKIIFNQFNGRLIPTSPTHRTDFKKIVEILNTFDNEAKKNDLIGAFQQLTRPILQEILLYKQPDGSTPPKLDSLQSKVAINAIIQSLAESELKDLIAKPLFLEKFTEDIALFSDDSIKKILQVMGKNVKSIKDLIVNKETDPKRVEAFNALPDEIKKLVFVELRSDPNVQKAILTANNVLLNKKLDLILAFSPEDTPNISEEKRAEALNNLENEILPLFAEESVSGAQRINLFKIFPTALRKAVLENNEINPKQKLALFNSLKAEEQTSIAETAFTATEDPTLKSAAFAKMSPSQRLTHLHAEIEKLKTAKQNLGKIVGSAQATLDPEKTDTKESTKNDAKEKIKQQLKLVNKQLEITQYLFLINIPRIDSKTGSEAEIVDLFKLAQNSNSSLEDSEYKRIESALGPGFTAEDQKKVFQNLSHFLFPQLPSSYREKILAEAASPEAKDLLDSYTDLNKEKTRQNFINDFFSISNASKLIEIYYNFAKDKENNKDDQRCETIFYNAPADKKPLLLMGLCPGDNEPLSAIRVGILKACYARTTEKTQLLLSVAAPLRRSKIFNQVLSQEQQITLLGEALTHRDSQFREKAAGLFATLDKDHNVIYQRLAPAPAAQKALIVELAKNVLANQNLLKALYGISDKVSFIKDIPDTRQQEEFFTTLDPTKDQLELLELLLPPKDAVLPPEDPNAPNANWALAARLFAAASIHDNYTRLNPVAKQKLVSKLLPLGKPDTVSSIYELNNNDEKVEFFSNLTDELKLIFFNNCLTDLSAKGGPSTQQRQKELFDLMLQSSNPSDQITIMGFFNLFKNADGVHPPIPGPEKEALYRILAPKSKAYLLSTILPLSHQTCLHYFDFEADDAAKRTVFEALPTEQAQKDFFDILDDKEKIVFLEHWLSNGNEDLAIKLSHQNYNLLLKLSDKSLAVVINNGSDKQAEIIFNIITSTTQQNDQGQKLRQTTVFNLLDDTKKDAIINDLIKKDDSDDLEHLEFLRTPQVFKKLNNTQQQTVFLAHDQNLEQQAEIYMQCSADNRTDLLASVPANHLNEFFYYIADRLSISHRENNLAPRWVELNKRDVVSGMMQPLLQKFGFAELLELVAKQTYDDKKIYSPELEETIKGVLQEKFANEQNVDYSKLSAQEKAYLWKIASEPMKQQLKAHLDTDVSNINNNTNDGEKSFLRKPEVLNDLNDQQQEEVFKAHSTDVKKQALIYMRCTPDKKPGLLKLLDPKALPEFFAHVAYKLSGKPRWSKETAVGNNVIESNVSAILENLDFTDLVKIAAKQTIIDKIKYPEHLKKCIQAVLEKNFDHSNPAGQYSKLDSSEEKAYLLMMSSEIMKDALKDSINNDSNKDDIEKILSENGSALDVEVDNAVSHST